MTTNTSPAISLDKIQRTAPGLVDLYKKAAVSLEKKGLAGQRAAVYLVLDRSGSMRRYYGDGTVQHLAEQALGLSANLDDDAVVPVVFFDDQAYPVVDLGLDSYAGRVGREHERLGTMGSTDYAAAMRTVIAHYQDSGATDPAFVVFQTDGRTRGELAVKALLKESSTLPIFWQFVGFGDPGSPVFAFLRGLDALLGRAVDNAGFFPAGVDPHATSDGDLYDRLMGEFPKWLVAARGAGIVR